MCSLEVEKRFVFAACRFADADVEIAVGGEQDAVDAVFAVVFRRHVVVSMSAIVLAILV